MINACVALVDDESLTVDDLMEYIPGPDFPTAGIINGRAGIVEAYKTGKGRILVRARATVEEHGSGREAIVITEIPYLVNKAKLAEKIAELANEGKIEGISQVRDESSKDGLRVVLELKRGEPGEIVLNNLYSQSGLQTAFHFNCTALVGGRPMVVNLKQMLMEFLTHRREVVLRRTIYQMDQAKRQAHILEGQAVALADIDAIVEMIRRAESRASALEALMNESWLTRKMHSKKVGRSTRAARRNNCSSSARRMCKPRVATNIAPELGYQEDGTYRLSQEQANAILHSATAPAGQFWNRID